MNELGTKLHIILEGKEKVWFTSDLHFGHNNICKPTFANRPWENAKEMGPALIQNWNDVVDEEDIVFMLGDFCWFDSNTEIQKLLNKLKGTIYIVPGNHDSGKGFRLLPEHVTLLGAECTVWIENFYKDRPTKPVELYLSHCPMMTWAHRSNGVPNLFGHIHSGPRVNKGNSDADIPLWKGLQYDVGVDNNEYRPVELSEIFKKLEEQ